MCVPQIYVHADAVNRGVISCGDREKDGNSFLSCVMYYPIRHALFAMLPFLCDSIGVNSDGTLGMSVIYCDSFVVAVVCMCVL